MPPEPSLCPVGLGCASPTMGLNTETQMHGVLQGLHQPMAEAKEDQGCKDPPQGGPGGFWLLPDSLPYRAG